MSELVRKINAAKWRQVSLKKNVDVSADAITHSMKTTANVFSVWEIDSEEQIDQAALAMVASGDNLETFDVVPLSPTHLKDKGIEIIKNDGKTKVGDLVKTHFVLAGLTYSKLGIIANHIVDMFIGNKVKRYTRDDLRSLLNKAIDDGRLNKEDLPESVSEHL